MSASEALVLYRQMMRESKKFTSYIYRTYALRRVRDAFKENKSITDVAERRKLINEAKENLEMLKRQTVIHNFYKDKQLVIEKQLTQPGSKASSNLFDL
ncbi:LYR motif-containing protein 4 [Halotydeus destructor]|nr:LYR motif-containing protein 4 [Halotydeus destructor]